MYHALEADKDTNVKTSSKVVKQQSLSDSRIVSKRMKLPKKSSLLVFKKQGGRALNRHGFSSWMVFLTF